MTPNDTRTDGTARYELYCIDDCLVQGAPAETWERAEELKSNHESANGDDHDIEIRSVGVGAEEIVCGNTVSDDILSDPLLPKGPKADQMVIEHRIGGHQSPPTLEYVAKCPLCYLSTDT